VLGLTSIALVCVLAVVVAALLVGVLRSWPRMGRPGPRALALRIVALCALNASTLGLIFVAVNRANGFYSSWSDLLGWYRGGGTIVALKTGPAHPAALVTVHGQAPVQVAGRSAPAGDLQSVTIRGQLSGLVQTGQVYLPPGYLDAPGQAGQADSAGAADKTSTVSDPRRAEGAGGLYSYPVLVAITGSSANGSSPYSARRLSQTIAAEISADRLPPLIAVMFAVGPGRDRGCLNLPGGPQAALFYAQDLPTAIGSAYRVQAQPGAWALVGDQAGGYCALQLALTSAGGFTAAAVPAGSYQTPPGPPGPLPWGASLPLREQDDLTWLLGHQPMQRLTVLFDGRAGPGPASQIMTLARPPMRARFVGLGGRASPLAPVLDRIGRLLGPGG
jgi:hypothetical protein